MEYAYFSNAFIAIQCLKFVVCSLYKKRFQRKFLDLGEIYIFLVMCQIVFQASSATCNSWVIFKNYGSKLDFAYKF
jgi:hypothetical protein